MTDAPAPARPRSAPRAIGALAIAAAVLLLVPYVITTNFTDDEFTALMHARQLLAGEVPYRDFFEFITPGSFVPAALLFAVVGPSLLAAHGLQVLVLVVTALQLYDLARCAGVRPWLAAQPGVALLFGLYRLFPAYSHHWLVLPLMLGGLRLGMAALGSEGRARMFAWLGAGLLAGLAFLVIQTDGVALAVTLTAGALLAPGTRPAPSGRRAGSRLLDAGVGLAGLALPLAAFALYLLATHAWSAALYDMLTWPRLNYRMAGGINDVPYGSDYFRELMLAPEGPILVAQMLFLTALYLAAPVGAVAALAALTGLARTPATRLLALATLALGAVAVTGRADIVHIGAYAYAALLFGTVPSEAWLRRHAGKIVALLPPIGWGLFNGAALVLHVTLLLARPGTWLVPTSPDARLVASPIIRTVHALTRPGDTIVAMPWGGFFYFYGRPPATRNLLVLHPREGYTTEAQAREVYDEIRRNRPKLVLMAPEMRGHAHFQLYDHLWYPLPGYHKVAQAAMPRDHNGGYDVDVYEREGP